MKRLISFVVIMAVMVAASATAGRIQYHSRTIYTADSLMVTWPIIGGVKIGKIKTYRITMLSSGVIESNYVTYYYSKSQPHIPGDSLRVRYIADLRGAYTLDFDGPEIDSMYVVVASGSSITVEMFR